MAELSRDDQLVAAHRQASTRFTYYLAAVALGVLAFSIQAYEVTQVSFLTCLYVISWICLLLAFLFSLARLETDITTRSLDVMAGRHSELSQEVFGQPQHDPAALAKLGKKDDELRNEFATLNRKMRRAYKAALVLLLIGIVLQAIEKIVSTVLTMEV